MNRELWFRILQVAVAAPWLLTVSNKADNAYFRIGLKMIALNLVILNAPHLITAYNEFQTAYKNGRAIAEVPKHLPVTIDVKPDTTLAA